VSATQSVAPYVPSATHVYGRVVRAMMLVEWKYSPYVTARVDVDEDC